MAVSLSESRSQFTVFSILRSQPHSFKSPLTWTSPSGLEHIYKELKYSNRKLLIRESQHGVLQREKAGQCPRFPSFLTRTTFSLISTVWIRTIIERLGRKRLGLYSPIPSIPPLFKSHARNFRRSTKFHHVVSAHEISTYILTISSQKYKKSIRSLRFITRLLSLILNALMIGVLSWALYKYYTTKSHPISPTNPALLWVTPATLWPTFVLLGIALITFFMNGFTLIAYCCGVGAANKVNTCSTVVSYIFLGVHVVLWGIAAGAFKMGGNGSDLWGYSCSDAADKIAQEVKSYVDFGKLCSSQVGCSLILWEIITDAEIDGSMVHLDNWNGKLFRYVCCHGLDVTACEHEEETHEGEREYEYGGWIWSCGVGECV